MEVVEAKWVCCQIGAREHYAVPRALHQHQALDLLLTDAWVRPNNPLGRLLPGLRGRFHAELAGANVYAPSSFNVAFELRSKLAGLSDWSLIVARNDWFQKVAVRRLSRIKAASASKISSAYIYA